MSSTTSSSPQLPFMRSASDIDQINFKKISNIMNQELIRKVVFEFNLYCELPKCSPAKGPERYYAKANSIIDGQEIHFVLTHWINPVDLDNPYTMFVYPNIPKYTELIAKVPL